MNRAGYTFFCLGALWASLLPAGGQAAVAAEPAEQKIIFIRHAEKPALGLGMLDCQGLNRALALPAVLLAKFGKPDFVFAADPHDEKVDGDQAYNYIRPLLTVAPTAVQLGLPINSSFGYADIAGLQRELDAPRYQNAVVLVAWEHKELEKMVKIMLQDLGGQASDVPHWKGRDFDSIYVLTIQRGKGQTKASFVHQQQSLNGQSTRCVGSAAGPP